MFATDLGRPLYEKLGFAPVRRSVSFVGAFRPGRRAAADPPSACRAAAGCARAATEADLPAILAVDRAAFGADRGQIVSRLPGFADRIAVLAADPKHGADPHHGEDPNHGGHSQRGIRGYAAAWRNTPSSTVIGPLVAPDAQAAERLITDLAAHAHGTIRLDLDPDRPELPAWASKHGLEPVSRTLVMARGELPDRGTPDRLFTPISVALA